MTGTERLSVINLLIVRIKDIPQPRLLYQYEKDIVIEALEQMKSAGGGKQFDG